MKKKKKFRNILKKNIEANRKRKREKMVSAKSAREILKESEIKNRLKECFEKCGLARRQLRKCVVNAMDAGLTKEEVLAIINDMATRVGQDEASLCAIIAIGQALRFEKDPGKIKLNLTANKEEIEDKLRSCFKKCGLARKQLRKCVVNSLDAGLTKEEVLAISDDIVGGLGKNEVSVCAVVAVDQVLRYEESMRAKPIDIVKERELEREDT